MCRLHYWFECVRIPAPRCGAKRNFSSSRRRASSTSSEPCQVAEGRAQDAQCKVHAFVDGGVELITTLDQQSVPLALAQLTPE